MKHVLITLLLGYGLLQPGFAQSADKVTIKLKNNGLRPREFKFVTRHPNENYPNVFTAFLLPGASYQDKFRVGTSIAQVNQAEIYATMSGRVVPGKPLMVVKADDNGKTINLLQ